MNKNILVTGGAGFLGSHLCKRLLKKNIHLICLDNLSTGKKVKIADLFKYDNFEFIEQDIINPIKIDREIHEIYNLACPASPLSYQKDPIHTLKTSVLGTLSIIDLAKKYNSKILFTSTSEVYGDPLMHPQKESYFGNVNPNGVRSCYDEGKRAAETLLTDFQRQSGSIIKIARVFNTYGPGMSADDGRVVSNFIVQALNHKNLTIYGEGKQTRSFCFVDDLIDGIIMMMKNDKISADPINLGNPNEFTIIALAKRLLNKIETRSKIKYFQIEKDDPKKRKPDISKAREYLGWSPKIELDEGLDKTINYFQKK